MSMTNRYDPYKPEHKVACQRTPCAGLDPHPGGRHLDQRDELYDGPQTQLDAASMHIRDSARKIIREASALTPEVIDLITYIEHLQNQVAAVRVDRDRQVREALRRSEDCAAHGEEIQELLRMQAAIEGSRRKEEAGRNALLSFLFAIDNVLDKAPEALTPDVLRDASRKTHAAHKRAWS